MIERVLFVVYGLVSVGSPEFLPIKYF